MSYLLAHGDRVAGLFGQHVALVAASLAIALAIALPLGIAASRRPRAGAVILGIAGALYTIPSLALLALLVTLLGLGPVTAVVALVVYAQMVLIRGVVALLRVELPAALPVVLGGVRVATVTLVALATVAAWINAGGLGVLLFEGILTQNDDKIVAGSLAAAALAIVADLALRAGERAVRR